MINITSIINAISISRTFLVCTVKSYAGVCIENDLFSESEEIWPELTFPSLHRESIDCIRIRCCLTHM